MPGWPRVRPGSGAFAQPRGKAPQSRSRDLASRIVAAAALVASLLLTAAAALFAAAGPALAADPWPGPLPGTSVVSNLPVPYEPSGAVWHPRLGRVFVVSDAGIVSMMDADGNSVVNWTVGGDLEGIAVADPNTDRIYLGVENPDSIREFDISTGQVLRTFDLTAVMDLGGAAPANSGLEALTFVPDAGDPEGGLFYAGLQFDGKIYVFRLPILSSASSTAVSHVTTITPVAGRADLAGLEWDGPNGLLYAVYDSANLMRIMQADGTFVAEYDLPGVDQEGIAIRTCDLFITEDSGNVLRYGYPADTGDDDGDGITNCLDTCNGSCCAPIVPNATLPGGQVGLAYDELLAAAGAVDPTAWTVTAGVIPTGLALAPEGRLSGVPTAAGTFPFDLTATDSLGCAGTQGYTVTIAPSAPPLCPFADEFDDGLLDPSWTYTGPPWTESGGRLVGRGGRRSTALADPLAASATLGSVTATLRTDGGGKVWLVGWRQGPGTEIQLQLLEAKDRLVLLQKVKGEVRARAVAPFAIVPGTDYEATIGFDGTTFTAFVDGNAVLVMPKKAGTSPAGTAGFGVRGTVGRFDRLAVCD